MAGVNKVILIGNLGADPDLKYTPNGKAVCKFRLATNEKYKDSAGQQQDRTEWHRIVAWGRQAESCSQYLSKGSPVYVEGKLRTNRWEDQEGTVRHTTEIHANQVQFLGGGQGAQQEPPPESYQHESFSGQPYSDDDIPF